MGLGGDIDSMISQVLSHTLGVRCGEGNVRDQVVSMAGRQLLQFDTLNSNLVIVGSGRLNRQP